MSYTPFNAPLLSPLLGDNETAACFSVKSDLVAMLRFEAALANAQAKAGLIDAQSTEKIIKACGSFEPDMAELQQGVSQDGMAVPALIRALRAECGDAGEYLHFGSTSQDVIDTSLTLRLKQVNAILGRRLNSVLSELEHLTEKFGANPLMARTRMQAALPVTVGHRLDQWKKLLEDRKAELDSISALVEAVQLGGPVGTLEKMGDKGEQVRKNLAGELELTDPGCCWHTDRARLVQYANWLSLICGALGKIGQDFALMAQNGVDELSFDGAGGSSAMAHKQNPVKAEVLLSQARFAGALSSAMQQAAIHEQERSGAAWTTEWMVLPQLCVVTGSALTNATALLQSITAMGE